MKIVRVTYTLKAEFAEQNQLNIQRVMEDLQQMSNPGIFYHVCLNADGKTFVHTAFFSQVEQEQVLFALPTFQFFQNQLKSSQPEMPPKQELLHLVGSSTDIFNK